jgi:hypothetical protein
MKKMAILLVIGAILPSAISQIIISYKAEAISGGVETRTFNGDSLHYDNGWLYVYKNGKSYTIDGMKSIDAPSTEENMRILKDIDEYYTSVLKQRCKSSAIGFFVVGTSMIFLGNIIADAYFDNKTYKLAERFVAENMKLKEFNDLTNDIKRNTKIIRYTTTGVGAIFQIVGVCQTVKLASGSFSYGIKDNGVTLTYKFR